MYIFLLVIGIIILGTGLYMDRRELDPIIKTKPSLETNSKVNTDILNRLEALESIVYSRQVEIQTEEVEYISDEISQDEFLAVLEREKEQVKIDNLDIGSEMKDKFKLIADHERGVYTLEQVCEKLNMQKGEVLLLKNFYKNYRN